MSHHYAIIITSINHPTEAVRTIAEHIKRLPAEFIVVGDSKSPADFHQPGCTYFDLDAQKRLGFAYGDIAPARHYARKNIGYLYAMRQGAQVIIETDDDNIPGDAFWEERHENVRARSFERPGWVNVYRAFTKTMVWPRGLPLRHVMDPPPTLADELLPLHCPIQQGLADDNPDVDAIFRLTYPLPLRFDAAPAVALRHAWSPFNSQNTTWFSAAFALLYLPYHCSFRMTDIWRSFVAQRIAYLNGWHVLYHAATVRQDRNEHDLMRDFEEEIPGYLHNERIRERLDALDLPTGVDQIPAALRACYAALVEMEVVGAAELPLLNAWLDDVAALTPH